MLPHINPFNTSARLDFFQAALENYDLSSFEILPAGLGITTRRWQGVPEFEGRRFPLRPNATTCTHDFMQQLQMHGASRGMVSAALCFSNISQTPCLAVGSSKFQADYACVVNSRVRVPRETIARLARTGIEVVASETLCHCMYRGTVSGTFL
jgi:hypothetical protein